LERKHRFRKKGLSKEKELSTAKEQHRFQKENPIFSAEGEKWGGHRGGKTKGEGKIFRGKGNGGEEDYFP